MTGKKAIWVTAILGLAVVAAVVLAEAGAAGENKPATAPWPYQVLSGQINRDFDALYVLDTAKGRLAVLKFEVTKDTLVPIAGRELTKDFGTKEPGNYAMTTVQVSRILGMLYVTDQITHKAIAYKVDVIQNTLVPTPPIDLNAVFPGS
jgi:hypothetical protein